MQFGASRICWCRSAITRIQRRELFRERSIAVGESPIARLGLRPKSTCWSTPTLRPRRRIPAQAASTRKIDVNAGYHIEETAARLRVAGYEVTVGRSLVLQKTASLLQCASMTSTCSSGSSGTLAHPTVHRRQHNDVDDSHGATPRIAISIRGLEEETVLPRLSSCNHKTPTCHESHRPRW